MGVDQVGPGGGTGVRFSQTPHRRQLGLKRSAAGGAAGGATGLQGRLQQLSRQRHRQGGDKAGAGEGAHAPGEALF